MIIVCIITSLECGLDGLFAIISKYNGAETEAELDDTFSLYKLADPY